MIESLKAKWIALGKKKQIAVGVVAAAIVILIIS